MKFKNHILLIKNICFLAFVITIGCTYSPTEKYINPVSPPYPIPSDTIQVDINSFNNGSSAPSSYFMLGGANFFYKLQGPHQKIKNYLVTLDGNGYSSGQSLGDGTMNLFIDPRTLSSGTHTVVITIITDTNTGSLADLLGGENYTITKSFNIIIDKVPPDAIPNPTLTIENGYLTMKWSAFNKSNFYLHVIRSYWKGNTTVLLPDTTLLTSSTSYVDKGYVGGKVTYSLALSGVDFTVYYNIDFDFDGLPTSITKGTNEVAQISWGQPTVGTFSGIQVVQTNGTQQYEAKPNTVQGDTLILGGTASATITLKSAVNALQNFDKVVTLSSTKNLPAFSNIWAIPTQKKFIMQLPVSPGKTYRYDFPTAAKEDSLDNIKQLQVSPDGQFGVANINSQYVQINPLDFSQTITITDWTNFNYSLVSVSNNKFVSIIDPGSNIAAFDLATSATQASFWTNANPPILSDDGQYIFINGWGDVYFNTHPTWPNSWPKIGKAQVTCPSFGYPGVFYFRNGGTSELLAMCTNGVQVYNFTPTGISLIRTLTFNVP